MKNHFLFFLFIGCFISLSCNAAKGDNNMSEKNKKNISSDTKEWKLVWSDEFNKDGAPDSKNWEYEEGFVRNNELQDYKKDDRKTSYVKNGKLFIKAYKDAHDGVKKTGEKYHFDFSSASLITQHKVNFKYGRIDVLAKIPTGRGVWPAIWMKGTDNVYGVWPKSGEIDIMEYVWFDNKLHNQVFSAIHNEYTEANKRMLLLRGDATCNTLSTEFHLYSLIWTENYMQILFDNKQTLNYNRVGKNYMNWPFDQDFFLLLNIAVGGTWGGKWGIDEASFPKTMEIDYVRYYQ